MSKTQEAAVADETEEEQGTSLYELFGTDANMEKKGIEIDYGKAGVFRIARAGGSNQRYNKVMEQLTKPYRRQIETGTIAADVQEKLLMQAFAKTVVLGWDGVKDREGNAIPFSYENCIKLFTDLPELFRDLMEQATKFHNFRHTELEEDVKN